MDRVIDSTRLTGLGRLCVLPEESGIEIAPPSPGLERIGARFHGQAYAPHRHDTYSLGITLRGVQTFTYRGSLRASLPGQVIVLHPDELHDGAAGTEDGLVYRMLYLEPALLAEALGGRSLPFVANPVVDDPAFRAMLGGLLLDFDTGIDDLMRDHFVAMAADALSRHAGQLRAGSNAIDADAIARTRAYLRDQAAQPIGSAALEAVSGLDRFSLARQFRAVCGTSPHRYLTMRRLDLARSLIGRGLPLADVAVAASFSDQSHLNRQFKKAYGMTPGAWSGMVESGNRASA